MVKIKDTNKVFVGQPVLHGPLMKFRRLDHPVVQMCFGSHTSRTNVSNYFEIANESITVTLNFD